MKANNGNAVLHLKRGTELYLYGAYPLIVVQDIIIPASPMLNRKVQIPCTDILAYGDPQAEKDYLIYIPAGDLTQEKTK